MIKLGSKVRDNITGLTGIAIARTEWLHGCARVVVEPQELKDGKPIEAICFDEQRPDVLEERPVLTSKDSSAKTGGPQNDPGRSSDPSRP